MKKNFSFRLPVLLAFISLGLFANAQSGKSMAGAPNTLGFSSTYLISNAAINSFNHMFGNATVAKWVTDKTGFIAYADQSGKKIKAAFDRKGRIQYTLTYYADETKLPANVLKLVKQNHAGKSVFGITEVSINRKTAYLVTLEDAECFNMVKVLDNEIYPHQIIFKQ